MDRIPLSFTQEFLCSFDRGDDTGPFGPSYHNTRGWRLHGEVDLEVLQEALTDVVARHEAVRTSIVRTAEPRYQEVRPPSPPRLTVRDLSEPGPGSRDGRVEQFLNEVEAGTVPLRHLPLLRAELGRFDEQDAVLVLLAHHCVSDGWSMRLLMRDLAACYAARKEGRAPDLAEPLQYREYTAWQRAEATPDAVLRQRTFWRDNLAGAQLFASPMDRPRSAQPMVTSTHRFAIDAELTGATLKFAARQRSSTFMVLLAAYQVLLHRATGAEDLVVPTITAGRGQVQFDETVGPFFNFLPLRTSLAGCGTVRDALLRTRSACLQAQSHEIPFAHILAEAPGLMDPFAANDRAVSAIQVFQHPFGADGEMGEDLRYAEIRRRLRSAPVSAGIPDGVLWTLDVDPPYGILGNVKFNRNEFDESTVAGLVDGFVRVLREIVSSPDSPLRDRA